MKILTDRKDIAKALNFGKYPVLTYNLDTNKGSTAVATKESTNYGTMRYKCTLYRDKITEGDGIFYLMTHASIISSHVSIHAYIRDAEYANAPVIKSDTEVAILLYSEKTDIAYVQIVKSGRVDPSYSSATTFTDVEK
jgi:hypothetical protein